MNELTVTTASIATTDTKTWDEWCKEFFDYVDRTPQTERTYKLALDRFKKWLDENNIIAPQRDDIKLYRNYLLANYKPTTVQMYMQTLRKFFRWTAICGYYKDVADNVHTNAPVSDIHKRDALTDTQVQELLAVSDEPQRTELRNKAIMKLALNVGLRVCEIVRADIGDLQEREGQMGIYIHGKKRAGKYEHLPISIAAERAIRQYLATRPVCDNNAPMFASENHATQGARLTTRSVSRIVKDEMRKVGINSPRLTAHSIRHTAITMAAEELIKAGDPQALQKVQQFARHTKLDTTLIYFHDRQRKLNNCGQLVANRLAQLCG